MPLELNKRERQIYEAVVAVGEASVSDVRRRLEQAPSYSAVRATLGLLVDRGWLRFRQDGKRYLYRPAASLQKTRRNAVQRMLSVFFGGSATEAMAALLDVSGDELTTQQYDELIDMLEEARGEQR